MAEIKVGKGVIRPRDEAARTRGNGAWEIKVDLPRARGEGSRKRIYATVHGSRIDAEMRLTEQRQQLEQQSYVERRKMTVGRWLEEWLRDYARATTGNKTFERYAEICHQHLIPALGGRMLTALEGHHVQQFYSTKQRERRRRVYATGAPSCCRRYRRKRSSIAIACSPKL